MNKQAPQDEPDVAEGEGDAEVDLLEMVLREPPPSVELGDTPNPPEPRPPQRIEGVVIGVLAGVSDAGEPLVEHPAAPPGAKLAARATVALGPAEVGRAVALMFEGGDPQRPIVMGLIHVPATPPGLAAQGGEPLEVIRDGERVVLAAREELVLRCGKASITLTRSGKILIHGAYLLARSSGVHRIQGGSVQIN